MLRKLLGGIVVSDLSKRQDVLDAKANIQIFLNRISVELIYDDYLYIYNLITSMYFEDETIIDREIFSTKISTSSLDRDEIDKQISLFEDLVLEIVPKEKYSFYVKQFIDNHFSQKIKSTLVRASVALKEGYTDEKTKLLYEGAKGAREIILNELVKDSSFSTIETQPSSTINLETESFVKEYEDTENGFVRRGIMTGFTEIDRVTYGCFPGELCLYSMYTAEGKCITGDSWIFNASDREYKRLIDLYRVPQKKKFTSVLGYDSYLDQFMNGVGEIVYVGKKDVYLVQTDYGEIKVADSHPFLTEDGFKKFDELSVGNKIAIVSRSNPDLYFELPENEVALLGYWCGNSLHNIGSFCYIRTGAPSVILDYKKVIESFNPPKGSVKVKRKSNDLGVSYVVISNEFYKEYPEEWKKFSNASILTFLKKKHKFHINNSYEKKIPNCVSYLKRPLLKIFIQKFVANWLNVTDSQRYLYTSLTQEAVAEQFRYLVSIFGIRCKIKNITPIKKQFASTRGIKFRIIFDNSKQFYYLFNIKDVRPDIDPKFLVNDVDDTKASVFYTPITRIEKLGVEDCYDILNSTAYSSFIANSMVVHNSFFLNNIAHNAYVNGHNVIVFSAEMDLSKYRRRLFTRHSCLVSPPGLKSEDIKLASLDLDDKKILGETVNDFKSNPKYGNIHITQVGMDCKMHDIYTKALQWNAHFPIDIIIIDYLELIRSKRNRSNHREEVDEVLSDAKELALNFDNGRGVVLWSVHQMKEEARKKVKAEEGRFYRVGDLSETSQAAKKSDLIVAGLRTDELSELNEIALKVLKVRDGEVSDLFRLFEDYSRSYIGNL